MKKPFSATTAVTLKFVTRFDVDEAVIVVDREHPIHLLKSPRTTASHSELPRRRETYRAARHDLTPVS